MPVPIADVGRRGRFDLTLTCRAGRTAIGKAYYEVPFKITRLHDSRAEGLAHLILMQCTAGIFGGDQLECEIHVERGARVLITQQSATKIHPSGGKPAIQNTRICVETGAELHLYCDPVIPFANSCFRQTTHIEVEPGARLFFWEGFMAGRVGRGERWRFEEFSSETSLRRNGRLLYLDRFRLLPGRQEPSLPWSMGSHCYAATGLYFGDQTAEFAQRLNELLPDAGVDNPEGNLAACRVLAASGPCFHRSRAVFIGAAGGLGTDHSVPYVLGKNIRGSPGVP